MADCKSLDGKRDHCGCPPHWDRRCHWCGGEIAHEVEPFRAHPDTMIGRR